MAIICNEATKFFALETMNSTYAMQVGNSGELLHVCYGGKIDCTDDLSALTQRPDRAFSPSPAGQGRSNSLNVLPAELAGFGSGDFRMTACRIKKANGSSVTAPVYKSFRVYNGKPALPGLPASFAAETACRTLEITLEDLFSGVEFLLSFSVFDNSDVIARSVKVVNNTSETVEIENLMSLQLDFDHADFDLLYPQGNWAYERHIERMPLHPGIQSFGSVRGSTGHQYNPGFVLAAKTASENSGEVYGALLVYSGSYTADIQVDAFSGIRALLGINPENFCWQLTPGAEFHSPEALLCYSAEGLNALSAQSHKFIMEHIIRSPWKHAKRPILVNNWEATYFDFDDNKIYAIAEKAASLGIEMLVLDDGWFGERNDDNSSLGDWFVNTDKLGDFAALVKRINALGLKFGLWFEPEMISEKSKLYEKHPEWVLCVPGKRRSYARNQLILDMSRKEVVDYLFETIAGLLKEIHIEYIKWDMNRNLTEIFSAALPAGQQGEVAHRYVMGVYELHERLLQAFPDLLIEGCSGGGGRFDAGMLYYAPQIWCSDDSDALERIPIQLGTSLFYPCSSMGAHVSVCPNHQTGRSVSYDFRAALALGGTFGYELDITKFTAEEDKIIREQVAAYHKYNDLVREGRFFRLSEGFGRTNCAAWCWVSDDRQEVLAVAVCKQARPCSQEPFKRLRFAGLDAGKVYTLEDGRSFHGSTLMNTGIDVTVALSKDASCVMLYLKAK